MTTGRRVRGSGSLFRKGTSRAWTIQYYREGYKDGAPVRVRVREATGVTSEREAQRILTERLSQVGRGEWLPHERHPVTVENLFLSLQEHYAINGRKSAVSLARRWKHLSFFAAWPVGNLTTDAVTSYALRRQRAGAANATINRELSALRRALNLGRRSTPPKVRVVPYIPMLNEDNARRGFVEDADFERLVAQASALWLRTFLELAFTYGWRRGELLGLRVRQLNFASRTIRLDPGTTKNGEGREVAMTAKVAELLRAAVAGKAADDRVLTREGGARVGDFRKAWQNLCTRAGLGAFLCRKCEQAVAGHKCECGGRGREYRGLLVHDLRRSAAKALRAAGVPESVIMATGGWRTASMFRRYAIVSSADQRDAMEKLEAARDASSPRSAPFAEPRPPAGPGKVQ
jgi:integrase